MFYLDRITVGGNDRKVLARCQVVFRERGSSHGPSHVALYNTLPCAYRVVASEWLLSTFCLTVWVSVNC